MLHYTKSPKLGCLVYGGHHKLGEGEISGEGESKDVPQPQQKERLPLFPGGMAESGFGQLERLKLTSPGGRLVEEKSTGLSDVE